MGKADDRDWIPTFELVEQLKRVSRRNSLRESARIHSLNVPDSIIAQPQSLNSLATGHKVDGSADITQVLLKWSDGDNAALEALWLLVRDDLRRLAVARLRHERPSKTLQPTAAV